MLRRTLLALAVAAAIVGCSDQGGQSDMSDTGLKTHEWSRYTPTIREIPSDEIERACTLLTGHPDKACARWNPSNHTGTILLPPPSEIGYATWGCVIAHETRHIREGKWHKPDRRTLCSI